MTSPCEGDGAEGKMEYGLMRLAGATQSFLPITVAEYEELRGAKVGLLHSLAVEEKFDHVVENFLELETALLQTALAFMVHPDLGSHRFHRERTLLDRRLMNLLTAVKTYVDQVPSHVEGVAPEAKSRVQAAIVAERDGRCGYRVTLALRNYVQHHDSLVHLVSYGSRLPDAVPGTRVEFTVNPYVHPERLRFDERMNKWDQAVLDGLRERGEQVELRPLVRDCLEGLWAIHSRVRVEVAQSNQDLEVVLRAAEAKYRERCPEEESSLGLAAVVRGSDEMRLEEVPLTWEFTGYRAYLETKNTALAGLGRRYVTSASSDQIARGERDAG